MPNFVLGLVKVKLYKSDKQYFCYPISKTSTEKLLWIMGTSALIILKKLKIIFLYFKKLCNKIIKVANNVFH
jgi:hypothetical protein